MGALIPKFDWVACLKAIMGRGLVPYAGFFAGVSPVCRQCLHRCFNIAHGIRSHQAVVLMGASRALDAQHSIPSNRGVNVHIDSKIRLGGMSESFHGPRACPLRPC